jgi:peptide/nickel transport system substrate-binding protein
MVRPSGRLRALSSKKLAGVALATVAALTAAGCAGSSGGSSGGGSTAGMSNNNNTVTWAETAGFTPNFIFPFVDPAHFGTWNLDDFNMLLFRPMYWFGVGESPVLNQPLSVANAPTFSADSKTVTVTMKGWKWSNGQTISANDVMFWMNMMLSEKDNYGGYVPGYFPDNLASVKAVSPTSVQFVFKTAYNHNWVIYNELSMVTPLPAAWDKTASGPSSCDTNIKDCAAVFNYLIAQNRNLSTYATNPLWQVVDGPFRLSTFNSDGALTMVPNKSYGGPTKAQISEFKEQQFTSDAAEYNVLKAGTSAVQVGYLPSEDITTPTTNPEVAGPNPLSANFNAVPFVGYSVNYFPMNFNNPTVGSIFKQLYFRQAFQYTVDTPAIDKNVYKGYGYPSTTGVPSLPVSPVLDPSLSASNNPYPFSVAKAKSLLTSNGWDVSTSPGTCAKPGPAAGDCGAGIKKGEQLSFQLKYASGSADQQVIMDDLASDASQAGIKLTLSAQAGEAITGGDTACTPSKATPCTWQMGNWGAGWIFAPDYYPSGEDLFLTGSVANYGSYSNAHNDALIKATLAPTATNQTMFTWEKYISSQVPVIFQPDYSNPVYEIAKNLKGAGNGSFNVFGNINPEDWYYSK